MSHYIDEIYQKIEHLNTIHAKKLKKNLAFYDKNYYKESDDFLLKYNKYLSRENKTIDYAIKCYLHMIADMTAETIEFLQTGKYRNNTFEEVNKAVYANPEIMEYHMHGLLLSQFLWKHHYQLFDYFIVNLPQYSSSTKSYLEIGAGHGLYLSKALELLEKETSFTVVDISGTSIELAKNFIDDVRVSFHLKNIFDYNQSEQFDFITMGEVLEHVEQPLNLLIKVKELLSKNGILFITTPTNAPSIDHIYLFNNAAEIRELIDKAGLEIISERNFYSEDVSVEKAERFKVTMMYGAFLKKKH